MEELKQGYLPVKVYVVELRIKYDSSDVWGVYQTLNLAKDKAQELYSAYVERLSKWNLYTANMKPVLDWREDDGQLVASSDDFRTLVISEWMAE